MDRSKTIPSILIVLFGISVFVMLSTYLKNSVDTELRDAQIVITAKVPEDDVFQLFYWEESERKFMIEKSVRTVVKGSESFQEILFELPTIKDLFRLRLDIGENKDQGAVSIKMLRFVSQEKEYEFDALGFNSMFAPNRYLSINENGQYIGLVGTNGEKVFYDPYFISNDSSREMRSIKSSRLTDYPYLIAALVSLIVILYLLKNRDRISVTPKGVFVTIFLLMLIAPTLQNEFHLLPKLENLEKRKMAERPDFSWTKNFVREFENFYDDNFGFRNRLVAWGASYKTKMFRSSKQPKIVMFGKDKWLFYNRMIGNSRMYKSYTRTNLLSADTLKLLVENWEERKEKYESEGRRYLMVFWPNKHSIYPEFMSSTMKMQIRDTITRVDQIINYLQQRNSQVRLTDVRPKLLQAKNRSQIYHKFDSHWNDYGAFLGYHDFFEQNREILKILPKSEMDFDITWNDYYGGELIQLLGVRNRRFFREKKPILVPKKKKGQIELLSIEGFPRLTVRTRNENVDNKLKVLIFRDSFTNSLEQFFSLHFYEVTYIWQNHNSYYVNKLQPDIIIDGFVEREVGNTIE